MKNARLTALGALALLALGSAPTPAQSERAPIRVVPRPEQTVRFRMEQEINLDLMRLPGGSDGHGASFAMRGTIELKLNGYT